VIERLAEAREWHYAFSTLVKQGRRIGIWFAATATIRSSRLKILFAQFRFSSNDEALFEASLANLMNPGSTPRRLAGIDRANGRNPGRRFDPYASRAESRFQRHIARIRAARSTVGRSTPPTPADSGAASGHTALSKCSSNCRGMKRVRLA
jgi:hypothetical protein